MEPSTANRSSLSAKFGTGNFPMHSDTAHWTTPARYVVLACVHEGDNPAPTSLLDLQSSVFDNAERETMRDGLFFVKNGKHSFYSSILSPLRSYFRYDPGCMSPINDAAHQMDGIMKSKNRFISEFIWQAGMLLIIDNWRILHGRGASPMSISPRKILRGLAV
jgi:Taurine catabolism dioxygenase TauD, TfdA family